MESRRPFLHRYSDTKIPILRSNTTIALKSIETKGTCDDFLTDLKTVSRFIGESYIEAEVANYRKFGLGGDIAVKEPNQSARRSARARYMTARDPSSRTSATTPKAKSREKSAWDAIDPYEGQNGCKTADMTKSNGVDVFMVYGSEIVVVTVGTMEVKSRTLLPLDSYNVSSSTASLTTTCAIGHVKGMLLVGENLVVFTEETCNTWDYDDGNEEGYFYPAYSPFHTKVFIYDSADMSLRTTESLAGEYVSSHAVGTNVYVTSNTYIDTSWYLTEGLDASSLQSLTNETLDESSYRTKALVQLEANLDLFVEHASAKFDCTVLKNLTHLQIGDGTTILSNSLLTFSSFTMSSTAFIKTSASMLLPIPDITYNTNVGCLSNDAFALLYEREVFSDLSNSTALIETESFINAFPFEGPTVEASRIAIVPGVVQMWDHVNKNDKAYVRVSWSSLKYTIDVSGEILTDGPSQVTVFEMMDGNNGVMPVVGEWTGLGASGGGILYQGGLISSAAYNLSWTFCTVNMSDPTCPVKAGELVLPGEPSFLEMIGENLVLGFRESSDEQDIVVMPLFDVSSFSQPSQVSQIEYNTTGTTDISPTVFSTTSFSTPVRYQEDSNTLLIPVDLQFFQTQEEPCESSIIDYSKAPSRDKSTLSPGVSSSTPSGRVCWNDYGTPVVGFYVYKIDEMDGISEYFTINHTVVNPGCSLQTHYLVINGSVITMKGRTVQRHDLLTAAEIAAPIDLDANGTNCTSPYS
jgi:Beta propeller domain